MNKCVFPGSFNPFTLGHYDILLQGLKRYGFVVVAVADETYKDDMLPLSDRVSIAEKSVSGLDNVSVVGFSGMLADFLMSNGIYTIIRGIRNDDDLAYEKFLEKAYKEANERIEIDYIKSNINHISSSTVRTIAREGGRLDGLVSELAISEVKRLYKK